MNAATRKSKKITGDYFEIYAPVESQIEVFSYIGDTLSEISVTYTEIENNMKEARVSADSDGYYFVRAGNTVQSLVKGVPPYLIFYFDPKKREDLDIEPKTYDHDGAFLGYNNSAHIGSGIYKINPLVPTPSIIEVFGKLFHSYPDRDDTVCPAPNVGASVVTIGVSSGTTSITIGGRSASVTVGSPSVRMKATQTVFSL
jgi:hypothetical protein